MLRHIFEKPNMWNDLYNHPIKDGYLSNVFDGTAYYEHTYFQGDQKKVCIQLYSAKFEACNPLGSNRSKQTDSSLILNLQTEVKISSVRNSSRAPGKRQDSRRYLSP